MSALRVPPPVEPWRGHVHAVAIAFGAPVDRRRLLAAWEPAATARRLPDGGVLLTWGTPRRIDVATAPGTVLVERGGALIGGPTTADAGDVVLPVHGAWRRSRLADLPPVDPAEWLDLALPVRIVTPLGPPPAPVAASLAVVPGTARDALGRAPPTPAEAAFAGAILDGFAAAGRRAPTGGGSPGGGGWLSLLLGALAALFVAGVRGPPFGGSPRPLDDGGPAPLAAASPLREWLRRLATPLWNLARAPAHEENLRRLFDLFDGPDLDEALRWAIPLNSEPGSTSRAPSWALPERRSELRIVGRRATGGTFGLPTDAFQGLRQRYERAYERLRAEGKIDEAAFVLAELLKQPARAVDLLEQEGRYEAAAKLAIAAELPAERIVRLWVRAGDVPRALLWARRTGAFGAALATLSKDQPEAARLLRRAWAHHLAARGDYATATTVAWVDLTLRIEAVPWLEAALASGTPAGAALLGRTLRQTDATYALVADRLPALLAAPGLEGIRIREALARGLYADGGPHGHRLLRPVLRALLADHAAAPELVDVRALRHHAQATDDPGFVADLPPLQGTPTRLADRTAPIVVSIAAGDVGATPILDLAWLPNGGLVVALGELGCRAYAADGRVRARFDAAATDLVPLAGTARCLALLRRPWGVRVRRLDVAEARETGGHEGSYTTWAGTSDGNLWFVAERGRVSALDLLTDEPQALWRVETGGPVSHIAVAEDAFALVTTIDGAREIWRYRLLDLRLLERLGAPPSAASPEALLASGALLQARGGAEGQPVALAALSERVADERVVPLSQGVGERPRDLVAYGGWRAWTVDGPDGLRVHLTEARTHAPLLEITLAGARRARVRLGPEALLVGDDRGRALAFDLATGRCLRDLRVL